MMRRVQCVVASFVLLAIAASGCSSGGGKTVKIGMIAPLTGSLAAFGAGMRKSAELAIDQAKAANKIPGWKIEFVPEDDNATAATGANAAQKLASDNQVVGVIGTLNSSVALAAVPILSQADIAMISPANSNPSLTQGQNWQTSPKRTNANYFRDVTTDVFQGKAEADYAYNELGKRRAVVMHDKKTYGQGLANIFSKDFRADGGAVLQDIAVNDGEGDYKPAVTRAKALSPDLIFYGGEYPEGGVIAKNMAELGLKPPAVVMLGGDGMDDATFVKVAGSAAAQGHYATSIGASATFLPSAAKFVTDYKAKYGTADYAIYGPSTYDAANIILDALAKVLVGKSSVDDSVRKDVIAAIQASSTDGALGRTSFDKYGDTTNRLLTINKVEGADFKPLKKLTVK
jgi:branched-chain amino acid transport system substrate-binding protein